MPLFMNLHINGSGAIAMEELEKMHRSGLALQHKYGVKIRNMWVNKEKGMVFCLMEARDKKACSGLHRDTLGDSESDIIEVSAGMMNQFIAENMPVQHGNTRIKNGEMDSGYRTMLRFEILGAFLHKALDIRHIEKIIKKNEGNLLLDPQESVKVTFTYAKNAFLCASQIKKIISKDFGKLDFRLAIVSRKMQDQDQESFWRYASDLSGKMAKTVNGKNIWATRLTLDLLNKEKGFDHASLKGIHVLSYPDEQFLYQLVDCIEKNLEQPEFCATRLANIFGISRPQLFRKIKKLTGFSPVSLIREVRMYEALKLLHQKSDHVAQIAYQTGFTNPSYFSKVFLNRFNILPSEYINTLKVS